MAPQDNPDLTLERQKATFKSEDLAVVFNEGVEKLRRRREIREYYLRAKELHDPVPIEFLDRVQRYENAQRKVVEFRKHLDRAVDKQNLEELGYFANLTFGLDGFPLGLHFVMLVPTIMNNADDEQTTDWLPRAANLEFIGTYAQTELGHGTNLRRLETTATYDAARQEFVLSTPSVSSYKWWPGNLAKSSNFVIVVARLITQGKDHGPHLFFVQIRDPMTHKSAPGVTVGDIGPKLFINTTDNGFLRLDNVRIPRRNMFMRNAKVQPDGTFIPPRHNKLAYGSMVYVRTSMIKSMASYLGQAATIAVRYSAVRRQGEVEVAQKIESQVLDYQTQQYRLLPQVARAWAFEITGRTTRQMYSKFLSDVQSGVDVTALLADLHSISSGLKAVVTIQTVLGIEQCRMGCGGHGYSDASGLPQLFACAVGGCTYEGENMVMLLQASRQLVKVASDLAKGKRYGGKASETVAYLYETNSAKKSSLGRYPTPSAALKAFEHVARRQTLAAFDRITSLVRSGKSQEYARNESGVELRRAATAHTRTFIARNFINFVAGIPAGPSKNVLADLLDLYLHVEVGESAAELLEDGFATGDQIAAARSHVYAALTRLRPNAVSIVDSFDFSDRELNSVLGRRDGNVYENLFAWAQNSPLNKHDVLPFHDKYLGKMLAEARQNPLSKL